MWKLCLLTVLASGCATSGLKPVDAERVPALEPEGAQPEVSLTVADLRSLERVYEDARRLLWPVGEGASVCQYSTRAITVEVWAADSNGMRYVAVGYNPANCPRPATFPLLHRDLAYTLAPDGSLLGPRVRGR